MPPSSQRPIAQQIMDDWNERQQRASLQAWQQDLYNLANLPPVKLKAQPKQHFRVDHQSMSYFPTAQQKMDSFHASVPPAWQQDEYYLPAMGPEASST
jgi:hypothetical protein